MSTRSALDPQIGVEFRTPPRRMTRERMRWYVDAQPTIANDDGRIHRGGPTIHDDDDYARSQGLPGIISDGMISTNWIAGLLLDVFGRDFLKGGGLRTKYIKPIFEDQIVICCARVSAAAGNEGGHSRYVLDVWCEDDRGNKLTVGEAQVTVPRS
jgi:hypothetical protein